MFVGAGVLFDSAEEVELSELESDEVCIGVCKSWIDEGGWLQE